MVHLILKNPEITQDKMAEIMRMSKNGIRYSMNKYTPVYPAYGVVKSFLDKVDRSSFHLTLVWRYPILIRQSGSYC